MSASSPHAPSPPSLPSPPPHFLIMSEDVPKKLSKKMSERGSRRRLLYCCHLCPLLPAGPQLRSSAPRVHCRTSTAAMCAQCPLQQHLNRDHVRPVFPAGPQPRSSGASIPCWTSTVLIRGQCSLPDRNARKNVRNYARQNAGKNVRRCARNTVRKFAKNVRQTVRRDVRKNVGKMRRVQVALNPQQLTVFLLCT